jgi:membrane-bound serine protease (ClpP class)
MIGAEAVVLEDGWVRIAGERWRAAGDAPLRPGETVRVVAIDGLTLVVER